MVTYLHYFDHLITADVLCLEVSPWLFSYLLIPKGFDTASTYMSYLQFGARWSHCMSKHLEQEASKQVGQSGCQWAIGACHQIFRGTQLTYIPECWTNKFSAGLKCQYFTYGQGCETMIFTEWFWQFELSCHFFQGTSSQPSSANVQDVPMTIQSLVDSPAERSTQPMFNALVNPGPEQFPPISIMSACQILRSVAWASMACSWPTTCLLIQLHHPKCISAHIQSLHHAVQQIWHCTCILSLPITWSWLSTFHEWVISNL